jgi:putative transposase
MSRFSKLSHVIRCCKYHIVWTPKYRYKVLTGEVKNEVEYCIRLFASQKGGKIEELNVQRDHVHLIVSIPPKSIGFGYGRSVERPDCNTGIQ